MRSEPVRRDIHRFLPVGYHSGSAGKDSDIDVAVVVDETDHARRIEITTRLFDSAFRVDPALEPKSIFRDEYEDHDPASILAEIINTAIEIV